MPGGDAQASTLSWSSHRQHGSEAHTCVSACVHVSGAAAKSAPLEVSSSTTTTYFVRGKSGPSSTVHPPGAAQLSGSVMLGTSTVVSGPSGAASDEKLRAEPWRTRPHGTASGASVAHDMRSRTAAGSRPPPGAPPAGGLGGASSKVVHASWMGAAKRT